MTAKSQSLVCPTTLQLGEVIIAAGQSGHPVCTFFRGYPGELLAAVWSYLAHAAGPSRALHVHGRAEVNKLAKKPGTCGLVLLHDPKQFGPVTWAIDAARSVSESRPSVVFRKDVRDRDAAPLPQILLQANPDEVNELGRFFATTRHATPPAIEPRSIAPETEILAHTGTSGYFSDAPPPRNDHRILFAFLCGVCLLRHQGQDSPDNVEIERSDAEHLRELLELRGVTTSLSRAARESLRNCRLP